MKTIKLTSYAVRLAYKHKEIFLLCPDKETAKEISESLMPEGFSFDEKRGDWVFADIEKASP